MTEALATDEEKKISDKELKERLLPAAQQQPAELNRVVAPEVAADHNGAENDDEEIQARRRKNRIMIAVGVGVVAVVGAIVGIVVSQDSSE